MDKENIDMEFYNSEFFTSKSKKDKYLYLLFWENKSLSKSRCQGVIGVIGVIGVQDTQNTQNTQNTHNTSISEDKIFRKYMDFFEKNELIKIDKSINPYTYKISELGFITCSKQYNEYIEKEKLRLKELKEFEEQKTQIKEKEKLYDKINNFIYDYIDTYSLNHQDRDVIIDWKKVQSEEIDFDVLMYIEENIEEFANLLIKCYNENFNSNKTNYRIIHFKTHIVRLKDLRQEHTGLLYSECEIDYKSGIAYSTYIIDYECPNCSNMFLEEHHVLDEKIREPFMCACGRKGKFKISKRQDVQFQKFKFRDLDMNLVNGESPISFDALLFNELAINPILEKTFNISDRVKITYTFKKYYPNKESEPKTYLHIYNIEHIDKIDFNNKFSEEELISFKDFSSKPESFNIFAESCFYKHSGDKLAKLLICSQIFNSYYINGSREYSHILCMGDPGTGKTSNFLNRVAELVSRSEFIDSNSNTKAGLLVASKKDDFLGKFIAELGAIPRANNGYLIIDELNDLEFEHMNCLPQPMEIGIINTNKMGVRSSYPARFKMLASLNPRNENNILDMNKKLIDQKHGLSGKFIDRFDFIIPFQKKFNIQKAYNDIFFHEKKKDTKEISDDFLRRYIIYTTSFNPKIEQNELFEAMSKAILEYSEIELKYHRQGEYRCVNKVKNLILAISRFRLSNEVKKEHIQEALEIYRGYINIIQDFGA